MAIENPLLLVIGPTGPALSPKWRTTHASNVSDAVDLLDADIPFHAVLVEVPLEEGSMEDLISDVRRVSCSAPVIVTSQNLPVSQVARLMRLGVHDVVEPNDVPGAIEAALQWHEARLTARPADEPWRRVLVGSSRAFQKTLEVIRLVGSRRSTVLITGETGTGKEMAARALHLASPRAALPMVAVNCNALPENLLEAELFGHVRGAFTGAVQQRIGRFEQANRSTLFLDEVGDLPLDIQTKLLRVLQEREFQRIGSSETIRVDVRIIAATNANLVEKIQQGTFREDLYYRLNVVPVLMPPLRDRLEDVPLLANHFLNKICALEAIPEPRLAPETLQRLMSYSWPGNVRQLENAVEMAVALSGERELLYPSDFPLASSGPRPVAARAGRPIVVPDSGLDFEQTLVGIERQLLGEAMRRTNGNKTAAAGMLGLKRTTLSAKLKSLETAAG